MGFIAISESKHFVLSKTIFTFPKPQKCLGIAMQNMEKLSLEPSLGTIRAQTPPKEIPKWIKIISTIIV